MPVAIVTGGESGIGKATCVELARRGFDVGLTSFLDEEGAAGAAGEIRDTGRRAEVRWADLRELPGAAEVVDDLADALGGLDVLVNNAGMAHRVPFLDMTFEQWREVFAVDLDAAFLCAQRAARRMVRDATRGRIINVTSVHEHVPLPLASAYTAAKGGLGLLTKAMALELAEHGIAVNAIAPGEIATKISDAHDADPYSIERPHLPAGRPGHALEIARVIAFLASEDASYMTGASVVADGGLLLTPVWRRDR